MTLLFTDVEGSTRMLHDLGDDYGTVLVQHHAILRRVWNSHRGVEVDTEGDSFFVAFDEAESAVAAAVEAQDALARHEWPGRQPVRVRMGVHAGSPRLRDDGEGYWGVDVHYAARLCSAANGGQVLLSESAAALVAAQLEDLGEHALKDFPVPRRVYHLVIDGRRSSDFAPVRTLRAGRTNLPDQISTLVGRNEETAEVAALVAAHRLVTLVGPGGVGKTRLSMTVAAQLLDGTGHGVWIAELAGLTEGALVPGAVADAVGLRLQPDGDPESQLVSHLAEQRLLLVLDNCEHVIGDVTTLAEALLKACRGVSVVATSREPLRLPGEVVYRVPSLALPPAGTVDAESARVHDSVRLFEQRAATHRNDFRLDDTDASDAVAIVRRLDGIPLAIELAAPWLAHLSVAELRARLDRGFSLLSGGSRTALARQHTIAAMIDWSYDDLPPDEQLLLDELSIFAGGFDLAAAEAVCAESLGDAVLTHLGALVDKSLVQVEDVTGDLRYRMLETVRAYAAAKLAVRGDEVVRRVQAAHLAYYLGLAERFDEESDRGRIPHWLKVLGSDRDNLRIAVTTSLADPDSSLALQITAKLARFWIEDGQVPEALDFLNRALERDTEPTAARASALRQRASMVFYEETPGILSSRLADVAESVRIAEQVGDNELAAGALQYRIWILMKTGELRAAMETADQALDLVTHEFSQELVCRLWRAKAGVEMNLRLDPRPSLTRALEAARLTHDVVEVARVNSQLGFARLTMGEVRRAREALTEAMQAQLAAGLDVDATHTALNLGYAVLLDTDPEEALRIETEVIHKAEELGAAEVALYALLALALVRSALGQDEQAATLHGAVDAAFARRGDELETFEADLCAADRAALRSRLGDEAFETCSRRGAALASEDVVRLAVDVQVP